MSEGVIAPPCGASHSGRSSAHPCRIARARRLARRTAFCTRGSSCPIGHPEMRNGPHKPTRRPPSKPARGDDENRAGIRELDCGEEVEAPRVIRRAEPPPEPEVIEPPPGLGEQRQAL